MAMMELVTSRKQGDATAAVEAVYRRDHARLWRSLLGFTGDPDLASEAESEAFTQALRRGDAVDDPAAWIWRTAFRVAGGLLGERRERQGHQVPLASALAGVPMAAAVVSDQPLVEMLSALDGLSAQQKAVIMLRYVAGLKPAVIADVLDTSPGTVRVQLHRAHEILKRTWSEQ